MMLDEMHLRAVAVGNAGGRQTIPQARHVDRVPDARCGTAPVGGLPEDPRHLRPEVRSRVARDGDVLNVRTGRLEAQARGLRRKARPVLDAVQPLFFNGERELAVVKQRRRGIAVERIQAEYVHRYSVAAPSPSSRRILNPGFHAPTIGARLAGLSACRPASPPAADGAFPLSFPEPSP